MLQSYQNWAVENENPQRDIEVENTDRVVGPNRHWWMQPLWQIAYPDNLIDDNSDEESDIEDTDVDNGNDEEDQLVFEPQPQDRPAQAAMVLPENEEAPPIQQPRLVEPYLHIDDKPLAESLDVSGVEE